MDEARSIAFYRRTSIERPTFYHIISRKRLRSRCTQLHGEIPEQCTLGLQFSHTHTHAHTHSSTHSRTHMQTRSHTRMHKSEHILTTGTHKMRRNQHILQYSHLRASGSRQVRSRTRFPGSHQLSKCCKTTRASIIAHTSAKQGLRAERVLRMSDGGTRRPLWPNLNRSKVNRTR